MQKRFLITPGPTPVPPEVLSALAEPVIHHRAPRFTEILKQVVAGMKYIYQTENDIIVLRRQRHRRHGGRRRQRREPRRPRAGRLRRQLRRALEEADRHLGRRGDRARLRVGHQGRARPTSRRRWPPTRPSRPCSCSTARRPPASSTTSRRSARSSPGRRRSSWSTPSAASAPPTSRPTTWHVDICVAGSQKALMVPPGLAYAAVSEKAWAVIEQCTTPRFYFDFVATRKKMTGDSAQTPYTPAVSLMVAQNAAIDLIKEEGLQNVFERHRVLGRAAREGVKALGLELFGPRGPGGQLRDRRQGARGRRRRQDRQDRPRQVGRVAGRRPGRRQGQDLPLRPLRLLRPQRHHRRPHHRRDGAGRAGLRRQVRRLRRPPPSRCSCRAPCSCEGGDRDDRHRRRSWSRRSSPPRASSTSRSRASRWTWAPTGMRTSCWPASPSTTASSSARPPR